MAMLTVGCGLTFVVGSKANDALKNPDSYVLFETSFFKTDEKEKQAEKYSKKMAEYYSHI